MERVSIFIDGANFYYLVLKKFGIKEAEFDFDRFVIFLANGRKILPKGKRFYIGTVREKEGDVRTKQAMARQTSLFTELRQKQWEIKTSKLKTRLEEIPIDNRVVECQQL